MNIKFALCSKVGCYQKETSMIKRPWNRPMLRKLVRSKNEETVLLVCKKAAPSSGPGNGVGICASGAVPGCGVGCSNMVGS